MTILGMEKKCFNVTPTNMIGTTTCWNHQYLPGVLSASEVLAWEPTLPEMFEMEPFCLCPEAVLGLTIPPDHCSRWTTGIEAGS